MLAEKYTSDYVSSESIYRQCCCVESVYYRTMLGLVQVKLRDAGTRSTMYTGF